MSQQENNEKASIESKQTGQQALQATTNKKTKRQMESSNNTIKSKRRKTQTPETTSENANVEEFEAILDDLKEKENDSEMPMPKTYDQPPPSTLTDQPPPSTLTYIDSANLYGGSKQLAEAPQGNIENHPQFAALQNHFQQSRYSKQYINFNHLLQAGFHFPYCKII